MKILDAKIEDVRTVADSVDMIVTANVGCMLQMRAGMERSGLNLPVRHIIEVLNECYY